MQNRIIYLLLLLLLLPLGAFAQQYDVTFKAEVIKILDERDVTSDDGVAFHQQNLLLRGLEKEFKSREITVEGISDFEIVESASYAEGDTVIVSRSIGPDNAENFYIIDYVRMAPLALIAIAFIVTVLAVARLKGLRALIILLLTFFILIKGMIPLLIQGVNPLFVSIAGSLIVSALAIFGTEGFTRKSHLSFISIVASLSFVFILSYVFTELARLTGVSEESAMLLGIAQGRIELRSLLLAGIVLGSIGVLDDVVISQVSTVKELCGAHSRESRRTIFKMAMRVGTDHINALVNTLFLAYAGAALPLLMLFALNEPPFVTFSEVLNNELIASEIVRTLSGSIALILAVPLSTYIAVRAFNKIKN